MKTRIARSTAVKLGWFSIGLGLAELLMTRQLARATGMQGREGLLRASGTLGLATGVALLGAARALGRERAQNAQYRDYSDRSGFPRGVAQARGIAAEVARQASGWMRRSQSKSKSMQRTAAP
jgi:hypothetical protein